MEEDTQCSLFFRGVTKILKVNVDSKYTRILFRTTELQQCLAGKNVDEIAKIQASYVRRHAKLSFFRGVTKTLIVKVNNNYTRILFRTSYNNV